MWSVEQTHAGYLAIALGAKCKTFDLNKQMTMLSEIRLFLRATRWQWLLMPFVLLVAIFAHECLHAAAILAQGGSIAEFHYQVWPIPSGHVRHTFAASQAFSGKVISAAPYVFWLIIILFAFCFSRLRKPLPPFIASGVFFCFYLIPLADLANAAASQMRGTPDSDLTRVMGPPSLVNVGGLLLAGLGLAITGFFTQRNLYRDNALSFRSYSALGVLAVILVAGVPLLLILMR